MPGIAPLVLWGGLECTVARVNDRFRDQIKEAGHYDRLADLGRISALCLRTLRNPVLLETVSPDHPDRHDWARHDGQLNRLRARGKPLWMCRRPICPTWSTRRWTCRSTAPAASGTWPTGAMSWHGFAVMLAEAAGLDADAVAVAEADAGAPRAVTVLVSERDAVMPALEHGIHRFLHDSRENWRMAVGDA